MAKTSTAGRARTSVKKKTARAPKRSSGGARRSDSAPSVAPVALDYKPRRWTYDVHPGVAMVQDWIATLKQKSGRSLSEWLTLANTGPRDEAARSTWLKREHGLGTNNAAWIAARSLGKGAEDEDPEKYLATASGWVESMFAGPKAALRPLYDLLLDAGRALGAECARLPLQHDRSALSQACLRAAQALHTNAN